MTRGEARSICIDLFVILSAWFILVGTMLVLQALGLDFGFNIWPIGEFRNWLEFLQNGPGYGAAKLFWAVDHRNALSPWWYLAARPLIDAIPAAPLILHLLVGLFVGIAAYLMLAELTRSRAFALSVGISSALFIPNVYRDEVIWNFVGALGFTLLSIWLFAVFCKDRRKYGFLAASYLAWLVAITTYTIQTGAMAAIFFVSLRERLFLVPWPKAVVGAVADALPYVAFLVVYIMLWITTSPIGIPNAFHLQFSFEALAKSIAFGIWNEHYQFFWIWLMAAGPIRMGVVFALVVLVVSVLLYWLPPPNYAKPTMQALGFALLIAGCIASPTMGLEAMSDMWTPGTRWPMLMQFWSPLVLCLVVFTAISVVPDRFWWLLWKSITACAVGLAILLVLGFNRTQVINARQERAFFASFQSAVTQDRLSGVKFPRRYLIQLIEPAPYLPVEILADPYAHTILGRDVTFRVVTSLPEPSEENTFLIWKDQHLSRPVPQ
jgi:hypothetical protein